VSEDRLPTGWIEVTLGEICGAPEYGYTTSATDEPTGVKFLRTTDITHGPIDWDSVPSCRDVPNCLERYRLVEGDIVISRAGSVGHSAMVPECPTAVFASYLIRFRPHKEIHRKYISYFLQSPRYWQAISESAAGIALQNVNAKKLAAISLPLCSSREQAEISG